MIPQKTQKILVDMPKQVLCAASGGFTFYTAAFYTAAFYTAALYTAAAALPAV